MSIANDVLIHMIGMALDLLEKPSFESNGLQILHLKSVQLLTSHSELVTDPLRFETIDPLIGLLQKVVKDAHPLQCIILLVSNNMLLNQLVSNPPLLNQAVNPPLLNQVVNPPLLNQVVNPPLLNQVVNPQ